MLAGLPALVPFRNGYAGALAVIDWDHVLPSKVLLVRVLAYYDEERLAEGEDAFAERLAAIQLRDRFPEFDVPDFAGIDADESYEVELDDKGSPGPCRLTSAWRREIDDEHAELAVTLARHTEDYGRLSAAQGRPRSLGDLEAVSWTPPCESGHTAWTLDVWYLLAFDGRMGTGRSFLVDLDDRRIVAARDFSVRAG